MQGWDRWWKGTKMPDNKQIVGWRVRYEDSEGVKYSEAHVFTERPPALRHASIYAPHQNARLVRVVRRKREEWEAEWEAHIIEVNSDGRIVLLVDEPTARSLCNVCIDRDRVTVRRARAK